ncbi:MAG: hypothetical protein HN509_06905 [Halobacteriovoraceae bacterium]|jgi:hypothetical protein|nr:hypothetical protein [Halobacteriovoraceae bacterium]MBT5095201.1 hypothetical protein [Halobacteriovoraceae bacterium]
MKNYLLALLLLASSCSWLGEDANISYGEKKLSRDQLSIIFSHNLNGETHPCGCRHHPLGGLPQVAGKIHEIQKNSDTLIVDSGDMLFPGPVVPDYVRSSLSFAAKNIARAEDQLGLAYFVPGDQDFALGLEFLQGIAKSVKYGFLISNLKDPKSIKHKEWAVLKKGQHRIYLLGVVDPRSIRGKMSDLFLPAATTIKKRVNDLLIEGYEKNNPLHRLIILSHAGMDYDKQLAREIPSIDWIIGSHSQSFTTSAEEQGKTKLIQVLSRNHYLGELKISLAKDKSADSFKIHEMRDDEKDKLDPNPYIKYIADHKTEMQKLQNIEQDKMTTDVDVSHPLPTAKRCIECHQEQAEHWYKTAHSSAFATLLNAKEDANLTCVKCHSLGLGQKRGFKNRADIVRFDQEAYEVAIEGLRYAEVPSRAQRLKKEAAETEKLKKLSGSYWKALHKKYSGVASIRSLSSNEKSKLGRFWSKLDDKKGVDHNFANVQCSSCHLMVTNHPFTSDEMKPTRTLRVEKIKGQCIECHDPDQSPEWYLKTEKGLAGALDEVKFKKTLKGIACPKYQD